MSIMAWEIFPFVCSPRVLMTIGRKDEKTVIV